MSKTKVVAKTAESVLSPIRLLNSWGVKSDYLFLAGFASIAASLTVWGASRKKSADDKSQSDRWGIFVGHWVPSFFALGIALQHEESKLFRK